MKKYALIILVLWMLISLIGCSTKILEEEYKGFETEIQPTMQDEAPGTEKNLEKSLVLQVEEYIKENKVSYSWKDVQYDMANKLNEKFVVAGEAELSDYYNYGFRGKEKDYFAVRITPYDGDYTNAWYLYLHRESFEKLFDSLKEGNRTVIATCEIPRYIYKDGQGNMAFVNQAQW